MEDVISLKNLPEELIDIEILPLLSAKDVISFSESSKESKSRCCTLSFWTTYTKNKSHGELQNIFKLLAYTWKTDMLYSLISISHKYNKTIDDISLFYAYLYYKESKAKSTNPILNLFLDMIKLNFGSPNLVDDLKSYDPLNTKKCIEKIKSALTTNNFTGIHEMDDWIPHGLDMTIFTSYIYNLIYEAVKDVFTIIDPFINFMLEKTNNQRDISTVYVISRELVIAAARNNNLELAKRAKTTAHDYRAKLKQANITRYSTFLLIEAVEKCSYDQIVYIMGNETLWGSLARWNLSSKDRKIYETFKKYYPFREETLECAHRCMSPEEWLVELNIIDNMSPSDKQKIEIMKNIIDKSFNGGYTYFSQMVKKELERIEKKS